MKISNQIVEDVVREVAGEDVLSLVKVLKNKKNVSEFTLAERLKIEINTVRNMLYRLYHANLVTFIRRKDKKKGWYIYYWTFNVKRIRYLMLDIFKTRYARQEEILKREQDVQFFLCPNKCVRMEFGNATEFEFKCPECGELMTIDDNSEKIKELKSSIKELEKEIKELSPKKIKPTPAPKAEAPAPAKKSPAHKSPKKAPKVAKEKVVEEDESEEAIDEEEEVEETIKLQPEKTEVPEKKERSSFRNLMLRLRKK